MTDSEDRPTESGPIDEPGRAAARLDAADEVVSTVLDGEAAPDDVRRVADQPELKARLDVFRGVADLVRGPSNDLAQVDADRMINAALAAFDERHSATATPAAVPPATSIAGREGSRHGRRRRWEWAVGTAAALVIAIGVLAALTASRHSSISSTAAQSRNPSGSTAATVDSGVRAGVAAAAAPNSTAAASNPRSGVTTQAGPPAGGGPLTTGPQQASLPSLGTFPSEEALMAKLSNSFAAPPPSGDRPQPAVSPPAPTATAAPAVGDSSPTSAPAHDAAASCTLSPGQRALGIAVVGGTRMLIARDDASGQILGYNATTCGLVFDRTP